MNEIFQRLLESSDDLKSFASRLRASGVQTVRGAVGDFGIVRSLFAGDSETERDETHYFMLPDFTGEKSGLVFSTRILPDGVLSENELPKVRVFHLASKADLGKIEGILVGENETMLSRNSGPSESDLANALERFAERVDQESEFLTGGIMFVGGVVTAFNPLVGIGITLAGWAASVGTKASVTGTEYLGAKVRKWNTAKSEKELRKEATKEVRALNSEIFENPILYTLERIASEASEDYDPFLDSGNWIDAFSPRSYYTLTIGAVSSVYDSRMSIEALPSNFRSWIEGLKPTG